MAPEWVLHSAGGATPRNRGCRARGRPPKRGQWRGDLTRGVVAAVLGKVHLRKRRNAWSYRCGRGAKRLANAVRLRDAVSEELRSDEAHLWHPKV